MANVRLGAGELRTRITLQAPTLVKDAGGAQVPGWANVATVWARWINDHGQEGIRESAQAVGRATVTIRHYAGILPSWRVLKGSDVYQLIAPPDYIQERGRWVEMRVERITGSV
jgi:SPP1 family predicted phage head-tail adaptor